MTKRIEALVNPQMLVWARKKSGYDLVGAAKRAGVTPERLQAWEDGELLPTINQAIKLSSIYGRPLSAFYLNAPPRDFSVAMTDFRRLPDAESGEFSPGLIKEIRGAQARREIMLELSIDVSENEGEFSYLNTVSLSDNPANVARQIRNLLDISWGTQRKWYSPNDALNGWKEAIEKLNVLVFHSSHIGLSFSSSEAHGFSISEHQYPVIVINSRDSHRRRIFTLLHEFAHLLLNEGGICDTWEYPNAQSLEQKIEVFCNHVAGAVLVPASLLMAHEIVRSHPARTDWPDDEIRVLADDFSTSQEVIVRRLLTLNLTDHHFYELKRQEYQENWLESKRKQKKAIGRGHPPYYRMVMRNNGKPFTRHVLFSYYDNRITLSDVSEFLGVKIKYIKQMEQELFTSTKGG